MKSKKRKEIVRAFMKESFGRCGELWKLYKTKDEDGEPMAWTPIPSIYITHLEWPVITAAETFQEVRDIIKAELPEEEYGYIEYEKFHYKGKEYFIAYD